MRQYLLLLIICLAGNTPYAQKLLQGKITSQDGKPVAAASVYLSNTSVGTVSREDGSFTISPFPEGRYDLVVSALGYETYSSFINAAELPNYLSIVLKPKVKEMDGVTIVPFIKDGWKEWGQFFMQNLIGETPNADDCKLLNKEVVRFRMYKKENMLEAVANEPLIIQNKALGYTLSYDLTLFQFSFGPGFCTYMGYPLFTEMQSSNAKTITKWQRNRRDAYEGSVMHFMRSVYQNKVIENGFELRHILRRKEKTKQGFYKQLPAMLINIPLNGDSIAFSIDSATVQLQFNDYLQVMYPAKKNPKAYINYLSGKLFAKSGNLSTKLPITSEIYAPQSGEGVQVLYNGHYYYSNNLVALQYWAWSEKLSNLLPLDYGNPVPTNAQLAYKPQ
jgi:CarboxypepD_reg-like domain